MESISRKLDIKEIEFEELSRNRSDFSHFAEHAIAKQEYTMYEDTTFSVLGVLQRSVGFALDGSFIGLIERVISGMIRANAKLEKVYSQQDEKYQYSFRKLQTRIE